MTYVRLGNGNKWRRQAVGDSTAAASAIKLKNFVVNKIMVHVTGDSGILRKSLTSGVTWTNAAMLAGVDACLDVVEDSDGGIWGLFFDTGTSTAKVGFSDDVMLTWTLKYTHDAGKQAFNISVAPERAAENKIAFTARDDTGVGPDLGDHFEVVVSTDSGATWATKDVPYRLMSDQDEPLIQYLSGRIEVMLRGRQVPDPPVSIWDAVATWDIRFVNKWGNGWADPGVGDPMGALDPLRDRAVVVLASSSGDPVFTVSGATSTLLGAWDSGTPANFGGDGHAWWRAYYVEPTADFIDFTGTTGVLRFATFFRNSRDLVSVDRNWIHDLEYHGSGMGTAIEIATASQSTEYGDVIWNWIDHYERSIDDLTYEKQFHSAFFNQDFTRHNSAFIPFEPNGGADSSIDWHIDLDDDGESHSTTMIFTGTAVADPMIFPNSVRVLVVANTLRLRGHFDSTMDADPKTWVIVSIDGGDNWVEAYENADAPLPVEMIRYGDSSPVFGAVADPNHIIRSTGGEWEEFDDPMTVGGGVFDIASLAYDLVSDRLFVSYISSQKVFALKHASTVDAGQANAALAVAAASVLEEGVPEYWQLIPSTDSPPLSYRHQVVHKKLRP